MKQFIIDDFLCVAVCVLDQRAAEIKVFPSLCVAAAALGNLVSDLAGLG